MSMKWWEQYGIDLGHIETGIDKETDEEEEEKYEYVEGGGGGGVEEDNGRVSNNWYGN